jgi:hypothetical protein
MKNIKRAIRLIAVQLGLSTSVALGPHPVAGREGYPITRSRLWTAVLALVIALPGHWVPRRTARHDSGLFSMDYRRPSAPISPRSTPTGTNTPGRSRSTAQPSRTLRFGLSA